MQPLSPIEREIFLDKINNELVEGKLRLDDKLLKIQFRISSDPENTNYHFVGTAEFTKDGTTTTYNIDERLQSKSHLLIGSWEKPFEKSRVSINLADNIPPEALPELANQTLLQLSFAQNGVTISSHYLKLRIKKPKEPI